MSRSFNIYLNRVSKLFPPIKDSSKLKDASCKSYQLMLDYGIISSQVKGFYSLLPLGFKSVEKLCSIIDEHLKQIHCQKILMPTLTKSTFWERSDRYGNSGSEVMKLKDRYDVEFLLSPTHEEVITNLVSEYSLTFSKLPLRLYQISSKFRDEMRVKHGLLRAREFLMKDLYTFDENIKAAETTFEEVCKVYHIILKSIGLLYKEVNADVGTIGGIKSKEFHIFSDVGEDQLLLCASCGTGTNIHSEKSLAQLNCPNCKSENVTIENGIEIGHCFLLGSKYSKPFSAKYRDINNKEQYLEMGCFGIGVTRLFAAVLESKSSVENLVWPKKLSPFKICIISPKKGSKESINFQWIEDFYHILNEIPRYLNEVILDDRIKLSIGQRLIWAKGFGFPIIIVIGKATNAFVPRFEVINTSLNQTLELTQCGLIQYLNELKN